MTTHHDPWLVALSVLIAVVASYAALDLAGRVSSARGGARLAWIVGGATAMGVGIWAMHFVGMLGFALGVPVLYDVPTVLLSLFAAVLASAIALYVASCTGMTWRTALPGGLMMGTGIAAMHYIGMAAMRMPAVPHYVPWLVGLSVLIAVAVSFVALQLAFRFREDHGRLTLWPKVLSALLMGAAVPSMHYTAMAAVSFVPAGGMSMPEHAAGIPGLGAATLAAFTLMILAFAIGTSMLDRRLAEQALVLRTSEHRAATELESQQRHLREIIDTTPAPIFVKDEAGRFLLANRAMADLYGTTPSRLEGAQDLDFNPDAAQVHKLRQDDAAVIQSGKPMVLGEERVRHARTGADVWFQVTKVPLARPEGRPNRILGVATDITDRKRLENKLREAHKMEAVGQLAGGVAHDFNNLLTVITGFAEVLVDEADETDPRRKGLEQILHASRRATELTRELLAVGRRQVLRPQHVDLNQAITDTVRLLRRRFPENFWLQLHLADGLGAIQADPDQLRQVLVNLAANARDAMPEGGTLTVATSSIVVAPEDQALELGVGPGAYVQLLVKDTGVGMDHAVRNRAFEPFFATHPRGEGTGMGLAAVYGIVKQSGGHISVDSAPGVGTTFRILFQEQDQASREGAVTGICPEGERGVITILLAEDEDGVRGLARTLLERSGYVVLEAADGLQALEIATEYSGTIDILVTDVVMPRMNGGELAKRLIKLRPNTPVLHLSGYTDDIISRHGVLDPGVAFLQKPFTPEEFCRKVREVLEGVRTPAS